jgi:hypothetical protein
MARRSKAAFLSAVSLVALVGLALFGAKLATEWEVARLARNAGATVTGISADPFTGEVQLSDVDLPLGTGRLTVGKVALGGGLSLVTPARAAQDVTLENVTLTIGTGTYRMPRIEVAGSSLDEAGVRALFDGSPSTEPLAARVAKLSATSITMPEIQYEQSITLGSATTTSKGRYENVVARDVVDGRAKTLSWSGMTMTSTGTGPAKPAGDGQPGSQQKTVETSATLGGFEGHDIDFAFMIRLYTEAAGSGPNPPVQVYGPFKLSSMSVATKSGTDEASKIDVAEVFGDGFTAHLSEKSWLSIADELKGLSAAAQNPSEPENSTDMFLLVGEMLEGVDAGSFGMKGISITQTAPKPVNLRIGAVEMGYSREAPAQGASPLLPAQGGLRFAIDKVAFSVPDDLKDETTRRLIAMGYKDMALSLAVEGRLNQAGDELVFNEFSLSGENMGKATISALLGNVTDDLFSSDEAVRKTALMGVTAKNLAITMQNGGLFDRLFSELASEQNKTPEELKTEYSMIAMVGVPGFLGGAGDSKALGQAIAKFIAKPGTLDLKAVAKDPAGFGLADYGATGGRPADILEQLEISAEAK